jgi:hypothetical protein
LSEETDFLQRIFVRQQELEDTYGPLEASNGYPAPTSRDFDDPTFQRYLKEAADRCVTEIYEANAALKNKPWKQSRIPTDVDHYKEEIADAFHFFVRWCIIVGMTAEDLYNEYFHKSEINKNRQRNNY